MPQCTFQNVLDDARGHLADPNSLWATNTILIPYAQRAYRKMYDSLAAFKSNRIEHTIYFNLKAYTSLWNPTANLVTDMAEPSMLWERGNLSSGNITDTSGALGALINVHAPAHNLPGNADVIVTGVTGSMSPWGRWFITVVDANNFTLNGSVSDGNNGTGGTFSFSQEKFVDMDPRDIVTDRDVGPTLMDYLWQNSVLNFRGATTDRQILMAYVASGNAPTLPATVIGIDNCLNFLGACTALYAARPRGWTPLADDLKMQCFGPKGEGDSSGGFIRDLVATQVLEMQRKQRTPKPFRASRNSPTLPWLI